MSLIHEDSERTRYLNCHSFHFLSRTDQPFHQPAPLPPPHWCQYWMWEVTVSPGKRHGEPASQLSATTKYSRIIPAMVFGKVVWLYK